MRTSTHSKLEAQNRFPSAAILELQSWQIAICFAVLDKLTRSLTTTSWNSAGKCCEQIKTKAKPSKVNAHKNYCITRRHLHS